MKDSSDIKQTYVYKLSCNDQLHHFSNVVLISSHQDRYITVNVLAAVLTGWYHLSFKVQQLNLNLTFVDCIVDCIVDCTVACIVD